MRRGNVKLITGALVEKILIDGKTATGVAYWKAGKRYEVTARAEVVLAAGAINSPQVMQRSGVGPGAVLQNAGVDVVLERAGVGANLQDHLEVYFQIACLQPITLYKHLNLASKALIGTLSLIHI